MEDAERVTFDVFATEFHETMHESFGTYLKGIETCTEPNELLILHTEFVLFTSKVFAELNEIVNSAEEASEEDYH